MTKTALPNAVTDPLAKSERFFGQCVLTMNWSAPTHLTLRFRRAELTEISLLNASQSTP
jgi:hypothetical protein